MYLISSCALNSLIAGLTFPIDQGAEAVKGKEFEVFQTFGVFGANFHLCEM